MSKTQSNRNRRDLASKPMTVEQIVAIANEDFFDDFYPPKNWFRTAEMMLKQASIYEHENDLQTAYYLLYRHARIILDMLPNHPQANHPQYKQQWAESRNSVTKTLNKLEDLKPRINRRYQRYQEKLAVIEAARKRQANDVEESRGSSKAASSFEEAQDDRFSRMDPSEYSSQAVQLANEKFWGKSSQPTSSTTKTNHKDREDFSSEMRNIGRRLGELSTRQGKGENTKISRANADAHYNYPNVPRPAEDEKQTLGFSSPKPKVREGQAPPSPPHVPSKVPSASPETPPPVPSKRHSASSSPAGTPSTPQPTFSTPCSLESGAPLRTVFLPSDIRSKFLRVSSHNTSRNLETLGILLGTLLRNAFFITHLVIPPQKSTSDTCEMLDEAVLHSFIEDYEKSSGGTDLLILGWIHTHPSQSCFLSSADLHTHVWYQSSLPESIAAVCAPSQPTEYERWGVFRLTDPPGMGLVRSCKRTGLFHPHEGVGNDGIFTDAAGNWPAGHVIEHKNLEFEVADLRSDA
ncbi:MAG: hypothetical protein M1831_005316 [Alyxoria varia]|nr:MAG: hypothetical protein M1831_005316 [Alyxoria varia]